MLESGKLNPGGRARHQRRPCVVALAVEWCLAIDVAHVPSKLVSRIEGIIVGLTR